jgi:hypothetical protein
LGFPVHPEKEAKGETVKELPNFTSYKECPECANLTFGQFDAYCPRCGAKLKDPEKRLASISDYARSLLIEFLQQDRERAEAVPVKDIPDCATESIRANGNVFFNSRTTRQVMAENWSQVETALDDYRETTMTDFSWSRLEELHVFCVAQHAEIAWREIIKDCRRDFLDGETITEAIEWLKQC